MASKVTIYTLAVRGKSQALSPKRPGPQAVSTPGELWDSIRDSKDETWYAASVEYWDKQEASYDGVLGGYGHVSAADVSESQRFLKKVFARRLEERAAKHAKLIAVDCGAGVGRVTKQLLRHHFDEVDLVEPSRHLLEEAKKSLADSNLGDTFCLGLQQFHPVSERYDVIWIQWALLYLTDEDAVAFFRRCAAGLKDDGIVIVKENICSPESNFVIDQDDKSLTRSHEYMLRLFRDADLQLLASVQQRNFPKELFKVQMYALKPKSAHRQA